MSLFSGWAPSYRNLLDASSPSTSFAPSRSYLSEEECINFGVIQSLFTNLELALTPKKYFITLNASERSECRLLINLKMISWAHENTKASNYISYFIGQQPAGTDIWKCHGPVHFTLTVFHLDYNYLRENLHWSLYHPSIIQVLVGYSPSTRVLSTITSLITTLPGDKRCHVMHSTPAPRVWCC